MIQEFEKRGLSDRVKIGSAGFLENGREAHPFSVQSMKRRGADIRSHRSRLLTPMMIMNSELILAMEEPLADRARMLGAESVYNLRPYATYGKETGPVIDPIGQPLSAFEVCAQDLDVLIPQAVDRILLEPFFQSENTES